MNAIIPADHGLNPMQVAEVFHASGKFDVESVAEACTKIIVGRGMGLTDYDAMAGLWLAQGKVNLHANVMAAAIKRSGKYDYRVLEKTDTACRLEFYSCIGGTWERSGEQAFTVADADRAGLRSQNRGVWDKYPRAMLFARAISEGYKTYCPDALGAAPVYIEEHGVLEVGDTVVADPPKVVDQPALPTMSTPPAPEPESNQPPPPPAPAPEPPPASTDEFQRLTVTAIDEKSGTTADGKDWVRYVINTAEGIALVTFRENQVKTARWAVENAGGAITAKFGERNKFKNHDLKQIRRVTDSDAETVPATPPDKEIPF